MATAAFAGQRSAHQILIIDGDREFANGLRAGLTEKGEVTVWDRAAGWGTAVKGGASALRPHVVLAGLQDTPDIADRFVENLRRDFPRSQLLVIAEQANATLAETVLKAGALGLIARDKGIEEFSKAIETIESKGVYLDRQLAEKLIEKLFDRSSVTPHAGRRKHPRSIGALSQPV